MREVRGVECRFVEVDEGQLQAGCQLWHHGQGSGMSGGPFEARGTRYKALRMFSSAA